MFLYGMQIMADGMQKSAGNKMKNILGMLTDNRILGVCIGALITAIIQSSGATTVMVVGFVSAGLMTLGQAIGVIMGANIGTTITAWIVSLSQIGDAAKVLNPEFYATLLIGIGAAFYVRSKKHKTAGEVISGIGLLFLGLKLMSESISPYTGNPIFGQVFTLLGSNPFLGILAGFAITAILQSSSVSVGILQTLALNGVVLTNAAIYLTLGQNIGSCVTALLSSVGGNRTAKRAAVMHLSFNTIGAILVSSTGFIFFSMNPQIAHHRITSVEISIFHTCFNLFMTIILLPFADKLVALSGFLVRKRKGDDETVPVEQPSITTADTVKHLDKRILATPSLAVETVSKEILRMGELAVINVKAAVHSSLTGNEADTDMVIQNEETLNDMEKALTDYLILVNNLSLNEQQKTVVTDRFNAVTDLERVGDHAENIARNIRYLNERTLHFSPTAVKDLETLSDSVMESLTCALEALKTGSMEKVRRVRQVKDAASSTEEALREKHIERLAHGECIPAAGIVFIDIISNLERISDHAMNLAEYVRREL